MDYDELGDKMKHVKMMSLKNCPHCRKALQLIEQLKKENLRYTTVEIEVIDEKEHPEIANYYDYWYVPAFYVNEYKIHEGIPTIEKMQSVLEEAIR